MKILFLSNKFDPDIGGIEVNSEILALAFHAAGHEVRLMTWSSNEPTRSYPFSIRRNPTLCDLVREHAWAELVYENNPCLRLAWPNLWFKRPSVIALRTWVFRDNGRIGIRDYLKLICLKRARKVIAVSDAVRKRCWQNAVVIHNPFRADVFGIQAATLRDMAFVFLGRLVTDKGADLAVRALHKHKLHKQYPHNTITLTIIGDGDERERLISLVKELGLETCVRFAGALRGLELTTLLNRHRFLLVPSVWEEPFGNVVLEGMACGCVPIVSDGGGLPEAVGSAGLTFKRGDVDDLVSAMIRLLEDPDLEHRLRKCALEHLANQRPEVVTQKYLHVIESAYPNLEQY